jgi:chromosome segregation ATPase
MIESLYEAEVGVVARIEEQTQAMLAEQGALAVSADDFLALEDRVKRAVELVKRERQARAAADARAADAEGKVLAQAAQTERLQNELNALRAERDQVRQRVERLLAQLDALEL